MNTYHLRELKIEVSRHCPLNCLHCSSNGLPGATERLTPDKISELIKEFSYLGGEKLCISGGEPLCYENLIEVLNSCQNRNLAISLYTTGITKNGGPPKPISDKLVYYLAEHNVRVIYSLHGATSKTHDTITQLKGSYNITTAAIEKTVDAGVTAEVHVVPMLPNFSELADMAKLVDSYRISKVSWLRFVPQGRGFLNRHFLQLEKDQFNGLSNEKLLLRNLVPNVTIRTGAPFNILCPESPAVCDAAKSVLTIGPDGIASPCDGFKQFRIQDDFGNILNHSLSEVWNKSKLLNAVRGLQESRQDSLCSSCSLFTKCKSGCLAQRTISAGLIADGRDPDCPLQAVEVVNDAIEAIAVH